MGEGLRVLSHLKGITDEKIDAIARDVNVELNQGVNNLDAKADKLVKDVQAETAEMRKIIESAEFGIPAPSLASMTAVSDEAGINVTVTATDATVDYSSDKAVLATTKGVMVRYKDGSYPANKEDGELAFIDNDLFTVDTNGSRVAKAKTHLVVGLTKEHTYYFSAFPYTQQGAHNERLGTGNVAKTRWSGNAATLTVSIAKDYDLFDLGEVIVTLHEDSTGETHTQKRTGVGNVVFSGIVAGTYTVSFAGANADCSNPDIQSVVLLAGTANKIDGVYKAKIGTLEQTSWAMISRVSALGVADKFWSVGDKKSIGIKYMKKLDAKDAPTLTQVNTNAVLVGFNQLTDESNNPIGLQFCTEDVVLQFGSRSTRYNMLYSLGVWCSPENSANSPAYPMMRKYIERYLADMISNELFDVVKPTKIKGEYSDGFNNISGIVISQLFPLQYPTPAYFTTTDVFQKKDALTNKAVAWCCNRVTTTGPFACGYGGYDKTGTEFGGQESMSIGENLYFPLCFCV